MKKTFFLQFVLTFVLFCPNINAQSPYKLSWGKESIIVGTSLISAIIGSGIDYKVKPLTQIEINQLNRNDINSFDRSAANYYSTEVAQISNIFLGVCTSSPLLFLTVKEPRSNLGIISVMYLETMMFSVFLPSYGKGGVQRIRPYVYNADAPLDDKLNSEAKRSFFSGHTTIAFSSAVFFLTVYSNYYPNSKWKPYIWGGSLLAASTVGYMRYRAGAHFPTDIIVGAVVGSAIGYLIPKLHENTNKSNLSLISFIYDNKACLTLNYKF